MRIIFFGTPLFAVSTLERLLAHPEFEVIAVVTQPDKRRGRGNEMIPSPVKKVALNYDLPIWQPKRVKKSTETLDKLAQAQADVFVVVAYGQLLSPAILAMPKLGCINVHGSLLPEYRGAAPIQWSLYHGDRETGITTMLMDEGMDTGPMLLKATTPVGLLENAHELASRLANLGADLLIETLVKLACLEIDPTPQDSAQATYAPLIQKSDYALDWSRVAIAVHNQVRGFYPNCFGEFRGKTLKVLRTVPLNKAYWAELPEEFEPLGQRWDELINLGGQPGEIVEIVKNLGPILQTGSGLLLLREVQLAGKRVQSGWDFVNGTRLEVGEILTSGARE